MDSRQQQKDSQFVKVAIAISIHESRSGEK
jgi:hypothetical protein